MKSLFLLLTLTVSGISTFDLLSSHTTPVLHRRDTSSAKAGATPPSPFPELTFLQKVNHLDGKNQQTFNQRYVVNNMYYRPGGPALLVLGYIQTATTNTHTLHIFNTVARELGGVVFSLEPRYYGKSWPVNDLKYENMKYLTSEQEVQDVQRFINNVNFPGKSPNTKWVVAGLGFYANYALMPNIVAGAVASSPYLKAQLSYTDKDQVMQEILKNYGSEKCLNYHHQVIGEIDRILSSNRRDLIENLKNKFTCGGVDDYVFAKGLDILSTFVPMHNEAPATNVANYCRSLKLDGNINEKLDDFSKSFQRIKGSLSCKEYNKKFSKDLNINDKNITGYQILYKQCTEFGQFAHASELPKKTVTTRFTTLEKDLTNICDNIFKKGLRPDIKKTNKYLQNVLVHQTNSIVVNGQFDVVRSLSVNTNGHNNPITKIEIKGATFANDYYGAMNGDTLAVLETKMRIVKIIFSWLR